MQRGDFKASLDTPILKYFGVSKVKNLDDRKRRMTLRDVLTMTAGLEWHEENDLPYDDPRNDGTLMEASDDWVQYAIDKPMAAEPGKVWNYSSGATELLAYIFQKKPVRTSTTTARNTCSHRWGSGMNGSARIWESWTPKAACI
jgi:CubicO group peptidase (beta-lactamase class C family)